MIVLEHHSNLATRMRVAIPWRPLRLCCRHHRIPSAGAAAAACRLPLAALPHRVGCNADARL